AYITARHYYHKPLRPPSSPLFPYTTLFRSGLFILIVARAFAIGRQAALHQRHFASLAAQGIGIWIGFQALINMGVNMGLLPTKGLTLPLMSYGGSGLLANFVALAILLRIDWENRQLARGLHA